MPRAMLEMMVRDAGLVEIVDAAMADAARNSGAWVVCKPGCTSCCMGPFPITQLDALRLQDGLADLRRQDPERAERVAGRARESVARMARAYPADTVGRVLEEDGDAGDEPCPALDPATGLCNLYHARPITCRTFGPAVRWASEAAGICELCYPGATDEQIAACRVEIDPDGLETQLLEELEQTTGLRGQTMVAFALTASPTVPGPEPLQGHLPS
jgi:Fe-S-cluster containining protein